MTRDKLPDHGAGAYPFPDPQSKRRKILGKCANCRTPLGAGDPVFLFNDDYTNMYCSEQCLLEDIIKQGCAVRVKLECPVCGHKFNPEEDEVAVLYDGALFCDPEQSNCLSKYLAKQRDVREEYLDEFEGGSWNG